MATGDILSVTVTDKTTAGLHNDGWYVDVLIEGFTTGMAVDLGSGFGNDLATADIASANIVFTITSEGYNASGTLGTVVRSAYATKVMRKKSPDDADEDQAIVGSDARVRLALNAFIYDDDQNGGAGTSGTDPTVTIAASTFRNDGGSSETSASATDLTVTNDSTTDYPAVHATWDFIAGVKHADRVKADFVLAVNADAGHGIAMVEIDADGGTSAVNDNTEVTTLTATERTATGLYDAAYQATVTLSAFTQGETITGRFRAYPTVGDADTVVDTSGNTTATDELLGRNELDIICDKSDLLDVIKYVATTGSDANGGDSSGDPYLTIGKALLESANVVLLAAGTYSPGNSNTRVAATEWSVIQPDSGVSQASAIVQLSSTRTYRHARLECDGVTVGLAGTSSWLDGENAANFVSFKNCDFDSSGVGKPTVGPGYRSYGCYLLNNTGDLGNEGWHLASFSSARIAYSVDGCEMVDTQTGSNPKELTACYRWTAVKATGQVALADKPAANIAPAHDFMRIRNSKWINFDHASLKVINFGQVAGSGDGLLCQGIEIEKTETTSPAFAIAADSSVMDYNDVLIDRVTIAGERFNGSYNDVGTTGYNRLGWFIRKASFAQLNCKADTFGTPSGNRTGGWPVLNGVNVFNIHDEDATPAAPLEYLDGIDLTTGSPGYVDDQSFTTAGAGGGDYTPDTGSTLIDRYTADGSYDMNGVANGGEIGATQLAATSGVLKLIGAGGGLVTVNSRGLVG